MVGDDDRERNESGQYADRMPPEKALDVFDRRDDLARPITASDVVDALGVARRTALNKLNELDAAGEIDSRSVGARARVFWRPIPADGSAPIEGGEQAERAGEDGPEPVERGDDRDAAGGDESRSGAAVSVEAVDVDALDLPGAGEDLRRRRNAVRAVLDHLREHGEAQAGELKEVAWRADGGSYSDARSLWKNCILDRALPEIDAAESAGPSGKWRWVGK